MAVARKTPRILQVFVPAEAGGLESVVVMLARGLKDAGATIAVSAMLEPGAPLPPSVRSLQEAGLEVFCHAPAHRAYLRERRLHQQTIGDWGADLVHTHGYRADLLAGSAAARLRRARVATVHGFTGGDWKNRFYERIQLRSFRSFDAILAVSRPIRERLLAVGVGDSRISVMPNAWAAHGVPKTRQAARAELGLDPDTKVIGWIGRLSREKGADLLLAALPRVGDSALKVSFVGDGAERAALTAEASALGVASRVRWHGVIQDAGLFYSAFDCFVLSSRTEGTPIALLEAMAAGIPIVAASVGGVPDVVSGAEAVLVPAENPPALAQAIDAVFGDPRAAAGRVERARERLARQFAPGPWIDRHLDIYRGILARRRGEKT